MTEYERLRSEGLSHNLADMFASCTPPGAKTATAMFKGHCNGSQFADDPERGDWYKSFAQEDGVNTAGRVYMPSLASFPGDPEAWVADEHDVRRICETRGYACEGAVSVKRPEPKPSVPVPLADDIAESAVNSMIAANPDLASRDRRELKEAAIEKHKGPSLCSDGSKRKKPRLRRLASG